MRRRMRTTRYSDRRRRNIALSVVCRPSSDQVLLADGGAQAIVIGDEFADEFVQSLLEDFLHPAVLEAGTDSARLALGRPLAAVGAGDGIKKAHKIFVAAGERARHLV